jgi:hypothetical protein
MNKLPIRYARTTDPVTLRFDTIPDGQRLVRSGTDIDGANVGDADGIGVRRVRVVGAGSTTDETATGVTTGITWDLDVGDHYVFILWEGLSSLATAGFQFIPVASGGLVCSVFTCVAESARALVADIAFVIALGGIMTFTNAPTTRQGVTFRIHLRVTTAGTFTLNYRREPGTGATITQTKAAGFAVRGV